MSKRFRMAQAHPFWLEWHRLTLSGWDGIAHPFWLGWHSSPFLVRMARAHPSWLGWQRLTLSGLAATSMLLTYLENLGKLNYDSLGQEIYSHSRIVYTWK